MHSYPFSPIYLHTNNGNVVQFSQFQFRKTRYISAKHALEWYNFHAAFSNQPIINLIEWKTIFCLMQIAKIEIQCSFQIKCFLVQLKWIFFVELMLTSHKAIQQYCATPFYRIKSVTRAQSNTRSVSISIFSDAHFQMLCVNFFLKNQQILNWIRHIKIHEASRKRNILQQRQMYDLANEMATYIFAHTH